MHAQQRVLMYLALGMNSYQSAHGSRRVLNCELSQHALLR